MNRRKFLHGLSAAALAGLPLRTFAAPSPAYRSAAADGYPPRALALEGKIPPGLRGTLYRNGPGRHDLGGQRYHHWFDGDGLVQAFRVDASGVTHSARFVQTTKYTAETEAGRFLYPAFGTRFAGARAIAGPDAMNVANINVLPFAGELLALWEGGSAYQLHPDTLATLGPKVWRRDLQGMPFSAHPRVEPDGRLWNFGVANGRGLVLYEVAKDGRLLRADLVPVDAVPMVHDFAVTRRSLVFVLPPLVLDMERFAAGATFLDSHVWTSAQPMRVLVIDKSDWTKRSWHELPAGFLFHIGNAWEDEAGVIRLDYMRLDDPSILFRTFREVMQDEGQITPLPAARPTLVRLEPGRAALQESRSEAAEFPRVDARVIGTRYAHLYSLFGPDASGLRVAETGNSGLRGIQRLDIDTAKTDRFDYGPGFMCEEHIHVADPASPREGSGWLIGTAIDLKRDVTVLSVFDATNLAAGPLARASLPFSLPAGLHGNFAPVS